MTKKEIEQIDAGLAITFMHIREILEHPETLERYAEKGTFFPVYLKDKGREALLVGIRPKKATA